MECNKHKNMVVLHAFSEGKCEKCDEEIITSHIPCDKVCKKCSEKYHLCTICGDNMNETETKKYAELIISMSTDFLMGIITEEHYKNVLAITVNSINKIEEQILLCSNFQSDDDTSSATKCKFCGREKWEHPNKI